MRNRTKLETLRLAREPNMKEIIRALWRERDQSTVAGVLRELESRSVELVFPFSFPTIPVGRGNIYAYRQAEIDVGKIGDQSILIHTIEVTTTGFSLEIDESEELTGIVIEYHFKKQ